MSFETNQETRSCERHGDYQATRTSLALGSGPKIETWFTSPCPRCAEEAEQKERARRIVQGKQWTHIPARFWDCSFDNYTASTQQQQHALRVARGYAENFAEVRKAGHNVTFCGTCGTGKTHLGIAVLNHIIEAAAESGHISLSSFRYTTVHDVIRDIRETWRHHSDAKETAVVQRYRDLSLLVLDEVGASMGGDAEQSQLFDVLDGRYRNLKPTLLISNLNEKGLRQCLGIRAFDRLTEIGSAVVTFNWESFRARRALVSRKELTI